MDAAFRYAVTTVGLSLTDAVRATSTTPAATLGLAGAGLPAGERADLVVLDSDLNVTRVMRAGAWVG